MEAQMTERLNFVEIQRRLRARQRQHEHRLLFLVAVLAGLVCYAADYAAGVAMIPDDDFIAAAAWRMGHKARQHKLPVETNPFARDPLALWWEAGWDRADEDLKRNICNPLAQPSARVQGSRGKVRTS
jgi:hypothetical protein